MLISSTPTFASFSSLLLSDVSYFKFVDLCFWSFYANNSHAKVNGRGRRGSDIGRSIESSWCVELWTTCLLNSLPGHFAATVHLVLPVLVISPTRCFAYGTFHLLGSLPIIWTFCIQDCSPNILQVGQKSVYYATFGSYNDALKFGFGAWLLFEALETTFGNLWWLFAGYIFVLNPNVAWSQSIQMRYCAI